MVWYDIMMKLTVEHQQAAHDNLDLHVQTSEP